MLSDVCLYKKIIKKIIYTPILILFGGNVVWCLLVSLIITCLPDFWLKGFVCYLFKNESISLQRAKLGVGLQNRTSTTSGIRDGVGMKWVNFHKILQINTTAETTQARMLKLHTCTQQTSALFVTALCAASATLECVTKRWKTLKSWHIWPLYAALAFLPLQVSDKMTHWKWNIEVLTVNTDHLKYALQTVFAVMSAKVLVVNYLHRDASRYKLACCSPLLLVKCYFV
jgi:hypothetical protein